MSAVATVYIPIRFDRGGSDSQCDCMDINEAAWADGKYIEIGCGTVRQIQDCRMDWKRGAGEADTLPIAGMRG